MTSIIDKALSCVGLMRVAKRDREVALLQSDVNELQGHLFDARHDLGVSRLEADLLRPDALLWRNARDKRAGKRGKANG